MYMEFKVSLNLLYEIHSQNFEKSSHSEFQESLKTNFDW